MRRSLAAFAALIIIGAMLSGGAFAQQPAYIGTWATKAAQCKIGQDRQDAPLIMRRDGYDQHEAHCKFSKVRAKGGSVWTLVATCLVEGDKQSHQLTLSVSKNRLTIRDRYGVRVLTRCR